MAKMAATPREADAIKKLDASALLAQERITVAAEKAQKMIDDACAVATNALEDAARRQKDRPSSSYNRGENDNDRLDRLEEQVDMINIAKNLLEIGQATRQEQISGMRDQIHTMDQEAVESRAQLEVLRNRIDETLTATSGKFEEALAATNKKFDEALVATNTKFEEVIEARNVASNSALEATNKKFDEALLATNKKFDGVGDFHDELIELRVKLEYVTSKQDAAIMRLDGVSITQEKLAMTMANLTLSSATEKAEAQSFMSSHVNTILALLVVGLVSTVLMVMWYSLH